MTYGSMFPVLYRTAADGPSVLGGSLVITGISIIVTGFYPEFARKTRTKRPVLRIFFGRMVFK